MSSKKYDAIVIGSGAGGLAAAYKLITAGKAVLVLEKGPRLTKDGNSRGVSRLLSPLQFRTREIWQDRRGNQFVPEEYSNVGGKTKWYGAALLRHAPEEFAPDPSHGSLGWPFGYDEFVAYYEEAEELLGVRRFQNERWQQSLIEKICTKGGWCSNQIPLALSPKILEDELDTKYFDGFASVTGYKFDAENSLLKRIANAQNFTILPGVEVVGFRYCEKLPECIHGVTTADGRAFESRVVLLAAGAMTSPRLLQKHIKTTCLELPCTAAVGANLKLHLVSTILAFSKSRNRDILRKTAMFTNVRYPHTSIQCLGWVDMEKLASKLPTALPRILVRFAADRASQYFVMTEDGSHPDNRVIFRCGAPPILDYDVRRVREACREHCAARMNFLRRMGMAGMIAGYRFMRVSGTAHAVGTLVAGTDPKLTIVDSNGQVRGMSGLYVADSSALPRSGKFNPGLTVYAWGLRVGELLARQL